VFEGRDQNATEGQETPDPLSTSSGGSSRSEKPTSARSDDRRLDRLGKRLVFEAELKRLPEVDGRRRRIDSSYFHADRHSNAFMSPQMGLSRVCTG
jgi:hypothetical protein